MQATATVEGGGGEGYLLRSTASTVSFPGYLAVYPPKTSAGLIAAARVVATFGSKRNVPALLLPKRECHTWFMQNLC